MPDIVDESKPKNNVKDITKARIKASSRPEQPEKSEKVPLSEIYSIWFGILSGNKKNFPVFPLDLIVCELQTGIRVWYSISQKKECNEISDQTIASYIREYSGIHLEGLELWVGGTDKSLDVARYCKSNFPLTARPRAYAFKQNDIYCFNKLDFDPCIGPKTPVFDEFIDRMSNSKAFKIYIGSLFEERSDRQQYLWMFGEGQNGKGSFARLLAKIFGPTYKSLEPRLNNDRFWTMQLIDRRVGVFEDANSTGFITTAWFKSLTGDDLIAMERKGGIHFTSKINTKFIIMSNEKPRLSSEKADMRRIIFCELKPISLHISDYEQELWKEAPTIVGTCITDYLEFIRDNGVWAQIPSEENSDLIADEEDGFEHVLQTYFDISSPTFECATHDFGSVMKDQFGKNQFGEASKFRRWLERKHGIKSVLVKKDGKVVRVYPGIKKRMYSVP